DVALAKRYAILTNLVEVVKGYVQYEREVLVSLVKLRNGDMLNRVEVDQNQMLAKEQLFALQESYPELKANEQFLSLQDAIQDVEEHLAASRRMYNSNVSIYNDLVLSFPSNMIGNMINAEKIDYFNAKEEERENINITL
ncbi:MAG: LemA family protein, partial [Erysipelotrichaceae bacterium]|nr:LemA family protein [Erysipelotrichaceae bacterium]